MNSLIFRIAVIFSLGICPVSVHAGVGADVPWTTYEAEDMQTTGKVLGPDYGPIVVEAESSGQKCVKLGVGQYIEFTAQSNVNAMVVRYSLPDAPNGGGLNSSLNLYLNGTLIQNLPVTSRYSWIYGNYPFANTPSSGIPRNFYDEARLKDISVKAGDVLRIEKKPDDVRYCIVDLVDLEAIAPPLAMPENFISLGQFGATGKGEADITEALRECIAAAAKQGKGVWVPAGTYKLTGDIDLPANLTLQGAGMWHTTFVGDDARYKNASQRVRFNGAGSNIHLADFAIIGKLNFRNDTEPNDGIGGEFGLNSTISRIWVEHTKTGMWINNSSNLVVDGCRIRDTMADGINFCVGMRNSTIQNCATRGTGDDCFAIWPATHAAQKFTPGGNVIRHCTGELPFLANGGAIYGGGSNRIEDCKFKDILSGCGILISTTFPTANDKCDNNFSGTTVVQNCDLWRSWRSAFQLCLDGRNISGVEIRNVNITDSIADGFSVVASDGEHGHGTLTDSVLENVNIPDCGLGSGHRNGLLIRDDASGSLTIRDSKIAGIKNNSADFTVINESEGSSISQAAQRP